MRYDNIRWWLFRVFASPPKVFLVKPKSHQHLQIFRGTTLLQRQSWWCPLSMSMLMRPNFPQGLLMHHNFSILVRWASLCRSICPGQTGEQFSHAHSEELSQGTWKVGNKSCWEWFIVISQELERFSWEEDLGHRYHLHPCPAYKHLSPIEGGGGGFKVRPDRITILPL